MNPLGASAALGAPRVISTLAYNALPVIGVLFWGWSAFALILLYWLENVIVGVRTALGMLAHGAAAGPGGLAAAVGMVVFFTFHFGLFCFVHGVFVLTLFGGAGDAGMNMAGAVQRQLALGANFAVGVAAIIVWQGLELFFVLRRGEHRRKTLPQLMGEPYPRMIVLHLAIILSAFVLLTVNVSAVGVVLIAILKTALDTGLAFRTAQRDANAAA